MRPITADRVFLESLCTAQDTRPCADLTFETTQPLWCRPLTQCAKSSGLRLAVKSSGPDQPYNRWGSKWLIRNVRLYARCPVLIYSSVPDAILRGPPMFPRARQSLARV